jgi:putative ABC transport system permease protein
MALGISLVVAVLVIYGVVENHFRRGAQGYNLIVGAKGGKLQLVMNTVYHLSQPVENIPYSFYKEFIDGKFASYTKVAIPLCMGDSYLSGGQTFRVVGTTPDLFDKIEYGRTRSGQPLKYAFQPGGRNFKHENFYEAVIGSVAAHVTGLKVGDTFQPSHGILEAGVEGKAHEPFTIVGILEPTGTPNDRGMFVNMEGFYLLEGHAKSAPKEESERAAEKKPNSEASGEIASEDSESTTVPAAEVNESGDHDHPQPLPENQREVTSILVLLPTDLFAQLMADTINEGNVAQAVFPSREIAEFFDTWLGGLEYILLLFAGMIVVVAGIGVMVSIYNSISDRRHEIAVMRALGASQSTVLLVVLLESILLSVLGGIAGILLGHGVIGLFSKYVVQQTGVTINPFQFDTGELILIPALVVLASLVGLVPARAAYQTDVAKALGSTP